jgi:TP901 family phage tail tape measure protein
MADAFNLTAQLNLRGPSNIKTVVADIRRQIGTVNANLNFKIDPATTRNLAQLNGTLRTFNTTLNTTQTTASNAAKAIASLGRAVNGINIKNLPQQINSSANAINKLSAASTNSTKALQTAATEMQEFGKQAYLAVRRFAAFSGVTSVIFGVTGAIQKGVDAFIEYDRQFVKLQQVTGESAAGLQNLSKTITSLATGLGVASSDITEVASTLAQAGLSARDTERALKALALSSLAPSFDDMNETVEGSIALMRQFGISASQLEGALGSVNSVAAKFAVEASDIITAIQRTGGVFATASKGVSEGTDALNEFIAVFTSVRATTRESAETIATGLRTIFTRIQRGSTIEALKEYGVNLTDVEGKFVGAYKAVELLSQGLNKLDPRDLKFSNIVEELGGFRQIGKVIPLIQQFATAQEALKVAQRGQGSLALDAAKAQDSLSNKITKVKEEFFALFREIGNSDGFQTLIRGALDLSSALIKIADSIKGVLPALGIFAAFKGVSALTQFTSGFVGAAKVRQKSDGGPIRKFATGGIVPGQGNSDTVPAMLTPGEFVIRKKAVSAIGANNLHKMNRYAGGGTVGSLKNKSKGSADIRKKQKEINSRTPYPIINDSDFIVDPGIKRVPVALTQDDFKTLKEATFDRATGKYKKGGIKTYEKTIWPNIFEDIAQKKAGEKWQRTATTKRFGGASSPIDLFFEDQNDMEIAEVKFTGSGKSVSDMHILSKLLRFKLNQNDISGFSKSIKDLVPVKPISVYEPSNKEQFLNWYMPQGKDKILKKYLGGLVQRFSFGGTVEEIAQRSGISLQDAILQQLTAIGGIKGAKTTLGIGGGDRSLDSILRSSNIKEGKNLSEAASVVNRILAKNSAKSEANQEFLRLAANRQLAVVGITGDRASTPLMTSGAVDSITGAVARAVPATLNTGSLPPALAKRVQALIRNNIERLVNNVGNQLAKASGSAVNNNRATIRQISAKDIEDLSGPIFEKALGLVSGNYDPNSKALDLNKGLSKPLAQLFGVPSRVPTDVTNKATMNNARDKIRSGQFDRGRLQARKNLGGIIQRFATGGLAKAPLVDDILQASGAILPKPSDAIAALINAGGGAVDVDRTLKRTLGDKAYSSAPSSNAKQAVLSKYFRDDQQRLEDMKSAPLTAFGKELISTIKSGRLNPKSLSIISKSQRTKGVPEYLHQLFGIPLQNMIFTQGGDKQPALDAIRNKGPRVNRVFKNLGGFIQRFKLGGAVYDLQKGTGLSNGEFDQLVQFANTNDFSMDEFKTYLAQSIQQKKNKAGLRVNPASLLRAITPEAPRSTQAQLDLANTLKGPVDAKYNPKYDKAIRYATGGNVEDTVPALLTPGEFVINKKAAQRIGLSRLHQLNRADKVQGFNRGGVVQKFARGGRSSSGSGSAGSTSFSEKFTAPVNNRIADQVINKSNIGNIKLFTSNIDQLAQSLKLSNPLLGFLQKNVGQLGDNFRKAAQDGNITIRSLQRAIQQDIARANATNASSTQIEKLTQAMQVLDNISSATANKLSSMKQGKVSAFVGGVSNRFDDLNKSRTGKIISAPFKAASGIGRAISGQAGFMASIALGALAGQGENIFGKETGKRGRGYFGSENAMSAAGLEAGATTLSAGLATAGSLAMIPGVGPFAAALVGGVTVIKAWTSAVEAGKKAAEAFANEQREKAIIDTQDKANEAFKDYQTNPNNINNRNKLIGLNVLAAQDVIKDTQGDTQTRISEVARNRNWTQWWNNETPSMSTKERNDFIDSKAKENAQRAESGADISKQLLEAKVASGTKVSDLNKLPEFKSLALSIAAADVEFQKLIADSADKSEADQQAAKQQGLNTVINKILNSEQLKAVQRSKEISDAFDEINRRGRDLAANFDRMADSFNQALGRTVYELEQFDKMSEGTSAALSGNASVLSVSSRDSNVLRNPKAYSQAEREVSIDRASSMFGKDKQMVKDMLGINAKDFALSITQAVEKDLRGVKIGEGNANMSLEDAASIARKNLSEQLKDVPKDIRDQILDKFDNIVKSTEADTAGKDAQFKVNELMKRISGQLGDSAVDGAEKIQQMALAMLDFKNGALNEFINATNKAAEAQLRAQKARFDAEDILVKGRDNLNSVLGRSGPTPIDIKARQDARIAQLSGGTTDPVQIRENIQNDIATKNRLEKEKDSATDPAKQKELVQNISDLSIKIKNSQEALDQLANSTEVASAALNKIQEIQKAMEGQGDFLDKLATATPEEAEKLGQAFMRLQNNLNGGINTIRNSREAQIAYLKTLRETGNPMMAQRASMGVLAQQRAETMSLFKELIPVFQAQNKSPEEIAEMGARLRQGVYTESGMFNNPMLAPLAKQQVDFTRDPMSDPRIAANAALYNEAINRQAEARFQQGALEVYDAGLIMQNATERFDTAVTRLQNHLETIRSGERPATAAVPKAKGGPIYASSGTLVNFQPKGTDTVPAMLTPGEFVINAEATAQHLPLLKAINSGNYNKGGKVSYLADGGLVSQLERLRTRGHGIPTQSYVGFLATGRTKEHRELFDSQDPIHSNGGKPAPMSPRDVAAVNAGVQSQTAVPVDMPNPAPMPQYAPSSSARGSKPVPLPIYDSPSSAGGSKPVPLPIYDSPSSARGVPPVPMPMYAPPSVAAANAAAPKPLATSNATGPTTAQPAKRITPREAMRAENRKRFEQRKEMMAQRRSQVQSQKEARLPTVEEKQQRQSDAARRAEWAALMKIPKEELTPEKQNRINEMKAAWAQANPEKAAAQAEKVAFAKRQAEINSEHAWKYPGQGNVESIRNQMGDFRARSRAEIDRLMKEEKLSEAEALDRVLSSENNKIYHRDLFSPEDNANANWQRDEREGRHTSPYGPKWERSWNTEQNRETARRLLDANKDGKIDEFDESSTGMLSGKDKLDETWMVEDTLGKKYDSTKGEWTGTYMKNDPVTNRPPTPGELTRHWMNEEIEDYRKQKWPYLYQKPDIARQQELEKQSEEAKIRAQESASKYEEIKQQNQNRSQSFIDDARAKAAARQKADEDARTRNNPRTGQPFRDAAEEAGYKAGQRRMEAIRQSAGKKPKETAKTTPSAPIPAVIDTKSSAIKATDPVAPTAKPVTPTPDSGVRSVSIPTERKKTTEEIVAEYNRMIPNEDDAVSPTARNPLAALSKARAKKSEADEWLKEQLAHTQNSSKTTSRGNSATSFTEEIVLDSTKGRMGPATKAFDYYINSRFGQMGENGNRTISLGKTPVPEILDAAIEQDKSFSFNMMRSHSGFFPDRETLQQTDVKALQAEKPTVSNAAAMAQAQASEAKKSSIEKAEQVKAEAQAKAQAQQVEKQKQQAAEEEQKRQGQWINSSNWLVSGLGYLGGVGEATGRAAYGAANVAAGAGAAAIGGATGLVMDAVSGESERTKRLTEQTRAIQEKQAKAGVLGAKGTDQNAALAQAQKSDYKGESAAAAGASVGLQAMAQGAYGATVELGQAVAGQGPIQRGEQTWLQKGDAERVKIAREGFGETGAFVTEFGQTIGFAASQGAQMAAGAGLSTGTSVLGKAAKGFSIIDNALANPGSIVSGAAKVAGKVDDVVAAGRGARVVNSIANPVGSAVSSVAKPIGNFLYNIGKQTGINSALDQAASFANNLDIPFRGGSARGAKGLDAFERSGTMPGGNLKGGLSRARVIMDPDRVSAASNNRTNFVRRQLDEMRQPGGPNYIGTNTKNSLSWLDELDAREAKERADFVKWEWKNNYRDERIARKNNQEYKLGPAESDIKISQQNQAINNQQQRLKEKADAQALWDWEPPKPTKPRISAEEFMSRQQNTTSKPTNVVKQNIDATPKRAKDIGKQVASVKPKTTVPAKLVDKSIKLGDGVSLSTLDKVQSIQQSTTDTLSRYASSKEAAKKLKNSSLFDIDEIIVDQNMKQQGVNTSALGRFFGTSDGRRIMQLKNNNIADDVIRHELGHSFQKNTGKLKTTSKADIKKSNDELMSVLGPDINKFLTSKNGYNALVKSVKSEMSAMYTAKQIKENPIELLTSLIQASGSKQFEKNKQAQTMLRNLMKYHGYAKGGMVYANNEALIGARQGTDTVPAMLTPGEFVVNRQAAQQHMPVLNAINNGYYNRGGIVEYLNNGGVVGSKYYSGGSINPVQASREMSANRSANGVNTSGSSSSVNLAIQQEPEWLSKLDEKVNLIKEGLGGMYSNLNNVANQLNTVAQELPREMSITSNVNKNLNVNGIAGEWNKYQGDVLKMAGEQASKTIQNDKVALSKWSEGAIPVIG